MRSLLCAVLLAGSVAFAAISAYADEEPVLATAIRTGLEDSRTAVERTPAGVSVQQTLQAAYARHEFRPFWSRDGKASQQAAALLATLRAADTYGLRPNDYLTYQGRLLAEPPSEPSSDHGLEVERRAQFDLALSAAAVRFITHVHFGRTDPRAAGFNLGASRPEFDVGAVVERLSGSDHVDQIIASSEPQCLLVPPSRSEEILVKGGDQAHLGQAKHLAREVAKLLVQAQILTSSKPSICQPLLAEVQECEGP